MVLAEIARAPGVGDKPGKALADRLAAATADREILLVIDNMRVRPRSGGSSPPPGFGRFRRAAETPFNLVYEARPGE